MEQSFKQLDQLIIRSQKILLVGHRQPDQDTLGAVLTFYFYLASLGKIVKCFTPDLAPGYLSFMPDIDIISNDKSVAQENWDLILFLDCASLNMSQLSAEDIASKATANLDHHASNPGFADYNFIEAHASSTCELAYRYLKSVNVNLDKRMATCLLSGILADTGGFANAATNSEAISIASDLVKYGVKINQIFNYVMHNKSLGGLRMLGEVLSRLKVNKELNIAFTYLKTEDFRRFDVAEEEMDGLSNFLTVITDVSAIAVFHLSVDKVKASWRTKRNDIDLSALCQLFGGGGHKKAAGFTVNWRVVEENGELVLF